MNPISNFLEKFKKILYSEGALKQHVSDAVWSIIGIKIELRDISIKNGVATIRSSPVMRSELYMKKNRILEEIGRIVPKNPIRDIR